jgi:hypothetical protein
LSGDYLNDAKQRLFTALRYQANSWTCARSVVITAEAHASGTNRRAIVSNSPGALIVPEGLYDDYIQRGESENRNKELKIELCGGRLSDHRFLANLLRLNMQVLALNLIIRLGRMLVDRHDGDPQSLRELRSGQPATWRMRIIKVAAKVTVSCRRGSCALALRGPAYRSGALSCKRLAKSRSCRCQLVRT